MKLLLDENLSRRLLPELKEHFPNSSQVALLKLNQALDTEIWNYAKDNQFAIVTQDADFHEYSLLVNGPPLVIWMRCGNRPKSVILKKLIENKSVILSAGSDPNIWCIEIY